MAESAVCGKATAHDQYKIYFYKVDKWIPKLNIQCDPNLIFKILPKKPYIYIYLYTLYIYIYAAKSLQSCPTLCDPIDGSPSGSPVPGILQARTLE